MLSLTRRIARMTVIPAACLMLAITPAPVASSDSAADPATPGESPSAAVARQMRLRKLHLVRPDLIPYPIAFEVCC